MGYLSKLKCVFPRRSVATQEQERPNIEILHLLSPGSSCTLSGLWTYFPRSSPSIEQLQNVRVSRLFLLKKHKAADVPNCQYLVATLKWYVGGKTRTHYLCFTQGVWRGGGLTTCPDDDFDYTIHSLMRPFLSVSDRVIACFRFPLPTLSQTTTPTPGVFESKPLYLHDLLASAVVITSSTAHTLSSPHHHINTLLLLLLDRSQVAPSRGSISFTFTSGPAPSISSFGFLGFRKTALLRRVLRTYYWQICIFPKNPEVLSPQMTKEDRRALKNEVEERVEMLVNNCMPHEHARRDAVLYELDAGDNAERHKLDTDSLSIEGTLCDEDVAVLDKTPLLLSLSKM